jgi:hypothetical protein
MMEKQYDDESVLTRYVWDNYQPLMTDFERRVGLAIIGRLKAEAATSSPQARELLLERWGQRGDLEVESALVNGPESFRRQVCQRLLTYFDSEIFVNRCPQCQRVVRTPRAKQCFWCGHDWHEATR